MAAARNRAYALNTGSIPCGMTYAPSLIFLVSQQNMNPGGLTRSDLRGRMSRQMKGTKADLLHELEERLRFETLPADISTRFINLSADRIDSGIEDAQRRVCDCLGLILFLFSIGVSGMWSSKAMSANRHHYFANSLIPSNFTSSFFFPPSAINKKYGKSEKCWQHDCLYHQTLTRRTNL